MPCEVGNLKHMLLGKKNQIVLPVFFKAINVAFTTEVKGEFFKVLVQVISELLLQAITENGKHNREKQAIE